MTGDPVDPTAPDDEPDAADDVDSPFRAPPDDPPRAPSSRDHSVFAEPWMQPGAHRGDPSDGASFLVPEQASEDHSVWDEPGRSPALSGDMPAAAVTWFRWYAQRRNETSTTHTWLVTIAVAAVGGLFAIVGTFFAQAAGGMPLVAVTIIGPTTEEIMKIALPLWLVERRPWLYRSGGQILVCAFASGVAFAVVENLIYLNIYIPNPSAGLAAWRWTVCVVLHGGCSTIAGWGVVRIWRQFRKNCRVPQMSDGAAWIIAAIVIHGAYNAAASLLEFSGYDF